MAEKNVTLCIVDEGYYRKFFALLPNTGLRKLKEAYKSHICPKCSKPELLDFWFDTVEVKDTDTPASLNMETGDIIDVRISEQVTRGACPVPPEQTIPNMHYLTEDPPTTRPRKTFNNAPATPSANPAYDPDSLFIPPYQPAGSSIRETAAIPTGNPNDRITLVINDQAAASLTLRIKKTTQFRKVLDAYAKHANRDPKTCRLYQDGTRLPLDATPNDVEIENEDIIDVYWEQLGG